jgi:hypothetical protein
MYKVLLGLSFLGVGIYFWGRGEQSIVIEVCGFVLVMVMFALFMTRKRHS